MSQYIHFGSGPHQCLGRGISQIALPTMLRVLGQLGNLRRAPGPEGELKKMKDNFAGLAIYMNPEQSAYSPFPTTMKVQWDGDLPSPSQK